MQEGGDAQEIKYEEKTLNEIFENIKIQIGKPYVFRHLKKCDHMVVFDQIRLWGKDLP